MSSKTAAPRDATPMMAQYLTIKEAHPDSLLFYRMGDFYELFFDDAVVAAKALDITLTKRGKHQGEDIPMAGVPVHSHESYLQRLIKKGFRVAVCEQTEDPEEARKKRGYKALVERRVTRLITSGTLTEDSLLDARAHNYLAALAEARGGRGLAWLDMTTGDFLVQPVDSTTLGAALARIAPGEILLSERLAQHPDLTALMEDYADILTPQPNSRFDSQNGRKRLEDTFSVATLDAFGGFTAGETAAAGALIDYLELTQKGKLPRLTPPKRLTGSTVMEIDAATRRNLELTTTLGGEKAGSLLHTVDRTLSGGGARLLAARLSAPLTDPAEIDRRLDSIGFFVNDPSSRDDLRVLFKRSPDLQRALSRLSLGRGGPRDLLALHDGLEAAGKAEALLCAAKSDRGLPGELADCAEGLRGHGTLVEHLRRALAPDPPVLARDGGFIAKGYRAEFDTLVTLRDESRRLIAALQTRYAGDTSVTSLKIKHNNLLGYFVEVPAKQADRLSTTEDSPFIHRQTMVNAVRYTTVELGELESKIMRAGEKALAMELQLFDGLLAEVLDRADAISAAAQSLAVLDLATALAHLAVERNYTRPVVDNTRDFEVELGRHPVVEAATVNGPDGPFVANDCLLSADNRLWLLTGPNMAGKSTFLRQNALIAILAQAGSYVPADKARIGAVDRLFSRVGAADDLARGRSTFMVEMIETAAILNQASDRSLVILDEIGRGTATFDGLSIAWAVIENLHEVNRCRALFATHYHELTRLTGKLSGLSCHTMRVKEWNNDVVFLHEVGPGTADRSYGIHVGRLAGLPKTVVRRAEQVLKELEKDKASSAVSRLADDLPLFSALMAEPETVEPSPVDEALAQLHPDELTPKDALEFLYRLKGLLDSR